MVDGCWLAGLLVCWNADRLRDTQSFDRIGVATTPRFGIFVSFCAATPQLDSVEGSSPLIQRGSFTTKRGGEGCVGRELDAELRGSSAGLARVSGVGADERDRCLVEGFCRVGLLHRVIANGEGVELALHNRRAGRQRDEQISTAIARTANAHHREAICGEKRGNEPLVVRASSDSGEAVALFEGAAFERGSLAGVERGTKASGLRGAAVS